METNSKQVHVDSMDEEIVARVASIDVAKDSGMVCTRVPHLSQPGKRTTTAWSVSARTNSIIEVADRLANERVERDLGPQFFDNRIRPERRKINHIRQLEALGYTVTLTPAA